MITPDEFQALPESLLYPQLVLGSRKTQLTAIKTQSRRNSSCNALIKHCSLASIFQGDSRQCEL
jgi:hypothetical protein